MELTKENYFSKEASKEWFSASQIKEFLACEASALAKINEPSEEEKSTALMVGSYVDAYFEGTLEDFIKENPQIFNSRTGELKADYKQAEQMIARAERDPLFMEYMTGEKQVIKTGELFGVPFKCKFDVYVPGKRIVDLKTVQDFEPKYKEGEGRLNFADFWNWPLQMAIYQAIEGNKLPCYLAVITKEKPSNIAVIQIAQSKLDAELEYLKQVLPRFDAIKKGIVEPERCEKCAYCRDTNILTEPMILTEEIINE